MDLQRASVPDLLGLSRGILTELKRRGVVRSGNAPAGDYAELLVRQATGGEIAPRSQKSWDVLTTANERLQVKARVIANEKAAGDRRLGIIRSWDFDALVIVLFDNQFRVWRAARLDQDAIKRARIYRSDTQNGDILYATDKLLREGDDWLTNLQKVEVGTP